MGVARCVRSITSTGRLPCILADIVAVVFVLLLDNMDGENVYSERTRLGLFSEAFEIGEGEGGRLLDGEEVENEGPPAGEEREDGCWLGMDWFLDR